MKLRNKKTGEIGELHFVPDKEYHFTVATEDPADMMIFKTLAELNEEWEDYEEPKEHWYIDCDGEVYEPTRLNQFDLDRMENIGNHFSSREEAEKAVEKLKAWKRLKDKGFRFIGIAGLKGVIYFCADEKYDDAHIMFDEYGSSSDDLKQFNKDLDLLFGDEKRQKELRMIKAECCQCHKQQIFPTVSTAQMYGWDVINSRWYCPSCDIGGEE